MSDKMTADDDVLIFLHTLFFGSAGKSTMRKRQLRLFAGFPESSSRAKLVEKMSNSKKWTISVLKSCADLFGKRYFHKEANTEINTNTYIIFNNLFLYYIISLSLFLSAAA